MANVTELSDANFEAEVLNESKPVLVDFWAPWCGPCRQIGPIIEALAGDNAGAVKIAKMNVDESANTAAKFGISSIPTILIFKNGEVVERFVGLKPKDQIQAAIDEAIGAA